MASLRLGRGANRRRHEPSPGSPRRGPDRRGWGRRLARDAEGRPQPRVSQRPAGPRRAMAGALGVRLGGTASYDGVRVERPALGEGGPPTVEDLSRGLGVYLRACALLWLGIGASACRP